MESPVTCTDPSVDMSASTSSGVSRTPSRLEIDAETTAAATLPRAIETNVIDDWIVDGTRQR